MFTECTYFITVELRRNRKCLPFELFPLLQDFFLYLSRPTIHDIAVLVRKFLSWWSAVFFKIIQPNFVALLSIIIFHY